MSDDDAIRRQDDQEAELTELRDQAAAQHEVDDSVDEVKRDSTATGPKASRHTTSHSAGTSSSSVGSSMAPSRPPPQSILAPSFWPDSM